MLNRIVLLSSLVLLAGCASVDKDLSVVAHVGRIRDKLELTPGSAHSAGAYRPGMGGAVGGLAAALLTQAKGPAARFLYDIDVAGLEEKISVPYDGDLQVGDCVAVHTNEAHREARFFGPNEASLVPSAACK